MSATVPFLKGLEAQEIFLALKDTKAFDFVEHASTLAYDLHYGRETRDFVAAKLSALRGCTTQQEIDELFATSRAEWATTDFRQRLTKEPEGAWERTMTISRLHDASGDIVDVGNPNNLFGRYLLERNPRVTSFTGVDHHQAPSLVTGDRLHFALQDDLALIPLPDDSADLVCFRLSLHHVHREAQESLLREARRVLRPQGRILFLDDCLSHAPGLTDNALTREFAALSDEDQLSALSMLDVVSCLHTEETVAYPFANRPVEEWEQLFRDLGCDEIDTIYWGFAAFTPYLASLAVIHARLAE